MTQAFRDDLYPLDVATSIKNHGTEHIPDYTFAFSDVSDRYVIRPFADQNYARTQERTDNVAEWMRQRQTMHAFGIQLPQTYYVEGYSPDDDAKQWLVAERTNPELVTLDELPNVRAEAHEAATALLYYIRSKRHGGKIMTDIFDVKHWEYATVPSQPNTPRLFLTNPDPKIDWATPRNKAQFTAATYNMLGYWMTQPTIDMPTQQ
jgi:hypothetical protein